MRKRRRLSDKLTIMFCAVLVAVSAFFYAPMDVEAQDGFSLSSDYSNIYKNDTFNLYAKESFKFGDNFVSDVLYRVSVNLTANITSSKDLGVYTFLVRYGGSPIFYSAPLRNPIYKNDNLSYNFDFYTYGNNLNSFSNLMFDMRMDSSGSGQYDIDLVYNFIPTNFVALTGEESASYQQGYNAGYSAGEQVGESNGYSNGYSDGFEAGEQSGYDTGFQAGKDSVDTESYYDLGYSAGYDAGYLSGYDDGYEEGYSKALKSVQGSAGQWGSPMFVGTPTEILRYGQGFYVSSYGLVDMEEYQSGVNGYFYNTVPGTYDGYTTISYNIPFYSFNNGLVKIDSDQFQVDFGLRDLDISVVCDDGNGTELANLFESRLNEVYLVYNGRKYYGNYDIGTGYVEFDFIAEGVGNPTYLNTGSMTLVFNIHNTVTLVTDADVSHFISAKYHNVLECSLGIPSNSYAIYIRPYLENDRVSANIQDQTNSLTNGFNDSNGNSVNNDFSSGLNDFETAEDSLFATATTGLKDFTFFDFQSVPAMVTGMSFVGSIMSGWFTQAGGASGVGIVLSILFSIMLVAMVLGLYRWYQSKGGKD